jgi:hypothetical protein
VHLEASPPAFPAVCYLQDDLFNLLKTDFDAAYNGNRAPFPVFVHAPWFTTVRLPALWCRP